MAAYAVEQRGYSGKVVLEEESRTTWENVVNAIPLVEDADRIVSNSLHAQKARRYLHRLRPDLARRLVRADDYRPGEWAPLKPFFAVYGLRTQRSASGAPRGRAPGASGRSPGDGAHRRPAPNAAHRTGPAPPP
jgi:hypothetical protein